MTYLTKKEILDQLKKLGVRSNAELDIYFREYEEYSTMQNHPSHSSQEYYERPEDH